MKAKAKPGDRTNCVDTHLHIFQGGVSQAGARYTPSYDATFEVWHALSGAVGVTHGVLVQTSFMGTDNSLLLTQLAAHPKVLRGIAVVEPDIPRETLAAMHAQGVRGIRLNLAGRSHDMAAWTAATRLWDALIPLGWHVELHSDSGGLADVIPALPLAMPLVLDHFGKPEAATAHDGTVQAVKLRRQRGAAVSVKLSAAYRLLNVLNPRALTDLWRDELGIEALVWGSDWPWTNHEPGKSYAALYRGLNDWLDDDAQAVHQVRWVNPARLYGWDADERR